MCVCVFLYNVVESIRLRQQLGMCQCVWPHCHRLKPYSSRPERRLSRHAEKPDKLSRLHWQRSSSCYGNKMRQRGCGFRS